MYDAEGTPIGMQYRNSAYPANLFGAYWFEKNLQGDIVAVYDGAGTKLISYTYDAWGNFTTTYHNDCTSSHHANLNPFRYRGYYFDTDTGLYYLQSRYYDPAVGRFLNADIYISTGQGLLGNNMFAYCGNNPVSRIDNEGYWWNVVIGAVVGAVIGFASGIVTELVEKKTGDEKTKEFDWGDVWLSTGIGAAEGALTALCPAAAVFISSGASIAETILDGIEDGESVREIAVNSIWAGVIGAAGVDEVPFVKGGMVNDAVKSIGNAFLRGVHPCVKKAARTTLINVTRRIGKELFSGMGESIIYGGLHQFVSWYTNEAIDRI